MKPQRGPLTPLDLHFSVQDRDRALTQGIGYGQNINLAKDMNSVRLIVFDRGSDAIGSVTMPVPAAAPH